VGVTFPKVWPYLGLSKNSACRPAGPTQVVQVAACTSTLIPTWSCPTLFRTVQCHMVVAAMLLWLEGMALVLLWTGNVDGKQWMGNSGWETATGRSALRAPRIV
jgi:hypothetical protein